MGSYCTYYILKSALNKAITEGYISKNPANFVELPEIIEKDIKAFTVEEQKAFGEAAKDYSQYIAYIVNLDTGLRMSELLALTWEDIDFDKAELIVNTCSIPPHVRILRNAFIPYSWNPEDVKKLLASIDRGSPKGKRDYAILLTVTRLGLRVSDIRSLEFSSLNWSRRTIDLTVQKTKKAIQLPLLDDIGWAIIDYLKNGRPKTKCTRVFIRHRAPYDAVGENESFYKELHRYMKSAGITPPSGIHCGLHSLRSTLARRLLETSAPLPVISETLGHTNINTTSIYLKIDLEGLKKCPLDPEEVFRL